MIVTNLRLKICDEHMLKAYCDVELDGQIIVHQMKIIERDGKLIICMPAKRRTTPCSSCSNSVSITDTWCGRCGHQQTSQADRVQSLKTYLGLREEDRVSYYQDIVHPITREARQMLEQVLLDAYLAEMNKQ